MSEARRPQVAVLIPKVRRTSMRLIRIWSGRIVGYHGLRDFLRSARKTIHERHPGARVKDIRLLRDQEWPFTVIDVAYRLEGERHERYVRSTALARSIARRARAVPIA
jgi:hypothetical protein